MYVKQAGAWTDTRARTPDALAANDLLPLPRVGWEGGSSYWKRFPTTAAAGWTDPEFFPVMTWFPRNEWWQAEILVDIGVNTAMGVDHQGTDLHPVTDQGLYVMAQMNNPYGNGGAGGGYPPQWSFEEVGDDPMVVGWLLTDEPDMGYGGWVTPPGENQYGFLEAMNRLSAEADSFNDGRFKWVNFGNGIVKTHWSPLTMDDMLALVDGASVDKYVYTSPVLPELFCGSATLPTDKSPVWPGVQHDQAMVKKCSTYGWMAKELRHGWGNVNDRFIGTFVETKRPFLFLNDLRVEVEPGSVPITYEQIEGAVWSGIANEARCICYFPHNNTGPSVAGQPLECSQYYSLTDCEQGLKDAVSLIHARIRSLATVINSQSYVWDFGAAGMDTMLKAEAGYAYIFVSVGIFGTPGSKTFTLPASITGTNVEVMHESRNLTVSGGQFTDTFAQEYSHHTYKVAI